MKPLSLKILLTMLGLSAACSTTPKKSAEPLRSCNTGDKCYAKGTQAWADSDYRTAATYYEVGCGFGHAKSCNDLGLIHSFGKLGVVDDDEAYKLYEMACEADKNVCGNLAGRLCMKNGDHTDFKRGVTVAALAAKQNSDYALRAWGNCLSGLGDVDKATNVYLQACEAGSGIACGRVAEIRNEHKEWVEARQMQRRAFNAFTQKCSDKRDGLACLNLGYFLDEQPDFRTSGGENLLQAAELACEIRPRFCPEGQLRPGVHPGEVVYVGGSSLLYLQDASTSGPFLSLGSRRGRDVHPFRVLEVKGGWVRVVSIAPEDGGGCTNDSTFKGLSVALWVEAEKLLPILKRRKEMESRDGTSLTLYPGQPLIETPKKGLYTVYTGGFTFRIYLDDEYVGRGFTPLEKREKDDVKNLLQFVPEKERLNGDLLKYGNGAVRAEHILPVHFLEDVDRKTALVLLRSGCVTARVRAEKAQLQALARDVALPKAAVEKPMFFVPKGAPLFWNGLPVGQVSADLFEFFRHTVDGLEPQFSRSVGPNQNWSAPYLESLPLEVEFERLKSALAPEDFVAKVSGDQIAFCGELLSRQDTKRVWCRGVPGGVDFASLALFPNLTDVTLKGAGGGTLDLAWVKKLPGLKSLHAERFSVVTSVDALVNATHLDLLNLWDADVGDLSVVGTLSELKWLSLGSAKVSKWPTSSSFQLRFLNIRNTSAQTLASFGDLSELHSLMAGGTALASLDGLQSSQMLTDVEISGTRVNSLEPLRSVSPVLSHVMLQNTPVTDLSPLLGEPEVFYVDATGTAVASFPNLKTFKGNWHIGKTPLARAGHPLIASGKLRVSSKMLDFCGQSLTVNSAKVNCTERTSVDLAPLAHFKYLKTLTLASETLVDLTPLFKLDRLTRIIAPNSAISAEQRRALHDVMPRVLFYHPPKVEEKFAPDE